MERFKAIVLENSTRVVTGVALIGLAVLIGIFNNFLLIWGFLGVIYLLSFHESLKLFSINDNKLYFFALAIWLIAYIYPHPEDLSLIALIIGLSYISYFKKDNYQVIVPILYPTLSMLFILAIYKFFGIVALLWLLVVVAFTDIGAYFVGKSFGKTKFCETSPKKTLEGVIGGVVIGTLFGFFVGLVLVSPIYALIISFIVAKSAIFGDLFESYLKRIADVKDSGNILPGHGGVLDRVDGYLFSGVLLYIILKAIN